MGDLARAANPGGSSLPDRLYADVVRLLDEVKELKTITAARDDEIRCLKDANREQFDLIQDQQEQIAALKTSSKIDSDF